MLEICFGRHYQVWVRILQRFSDWSAKQNALFRTSKSQTIANIIDKDLPYVPWLTPYLYVLAGMGMTIAVQSSSIILAILTPICGLGIVSLERAYPIVVGCDIGTTFTGLLAAFANPGTGNWVKLSFNSYCVQSWRDQNYFLTAGPLTFWPPDRQIWIPVRTD